MTAGGDLTPRRYAAWMERFDALCDLPSEERAVELAALRASDPAAADGLERLLAHDTGPTLGPGSGVAPLALALAHDEPSPGTGDPAAPGGPTLVGHTLEGGLHVEALIAVGGYGEVYRARAPEGLVAVKLLRATALGAREERRFLREFHTVSQLDHPGCLRVLAQGTHEGRRFLVMRYAPGGDLRRLVGAPPAVLLPLLVQLCDALAHVHARGIFHRDLKPANVLLDDSAPPRPLLADFGIAKNSGPGLSVLSSGGRMLGTIDFVAPEQALGQPCDARADLFALGCMIFQLWSGRLPYEGSTFERLVGRIDHDAPRLRAVVPAVPAGLDELVARLLERDPARRPDSAAVAGAALAALAE